MKPLIVLLTLASFAPITARAAAAADDAPAVRKHWFVSGRVQGVGFRAFTYEAATDLHLKGWVRNLTDGRVEAVAEGDEKSINDLLARVKKGPRSAQVKSVEEAHADAAEKLAPKFEIRDTAEPPKKDK
jgi:acylphosphatase